MKYRSICRTISRRTFIKNGLLALAGVAGGAGLRRAQGAESLPGADRKEDALFSFVQLNDTHIHMPGRTVYEKDNEKRDFSPETTISGGHFMT
jgi:hypothetical protein